MNAALSMRLMPALVVLISMMTSYAISELLRPREKLADDIHSFVLDEVIPKQFRDWKLDPTVMPIAVSQDVQMNLDRVYDQIVSRTYVNSHGDRVMLSIAYGREQNNSLQVHRPEVCYVAQGFRVGPKTSDQLETPTGQIPVAHVVARLSQRTEPITYWITVGNTIALGRWEQRLARFKLGLTGKIPDGILIRVSNISSDEPQSYRLHAAFVADMLSAVDPQTRARLTGSSFDQLR
jgi:EpsI family protein